VGAEGVVGEEIGGEPFVSFRQNQKSVTAVVRVADIEEASVAVEIARTSVHMRFSALADAGGAGGAEACKGVSKRRVNYAHTLHLSADVDPMQSRYDVSSSNLVLVLRKAEDTRWPTFTGAPRDSAAAADTASGCGANTAAAYDAAQEAPGSALPAAAAAAAAASAARAEESDAADGKQEQTKCVRFGGEVGPTGGGGGGGAGGGGASGAGEGAGCVCCAAAGEAGLGLAGGREAETTASKEASKEASKAEARRVVGANGEVFERGDYFAGSKVSLSPRITICMCTIRYTPLLAPRCVCVSSCSMLLCICPRYFYTCSHNPMYIGSLLGRIYRSCSRPLTVPSLPRRLEWSSRWGRWGWATTQVLSLLALLEHQYKY
jgi:hypothetical protein